MREGGMAKTTYLPKSTIYRETGTKRSGNRYNTVVIGYRIKRRDYDHKIRNQEAIYGTGDTYLF